MELNENTTPHKANQEVHLIIQKHSQIKSSVEHQLGHSDKMICVCVCVCERHL
jgi:hypothetical protein